MKTSNIYTQEQIKRVLVGSGVDIEAEFGNDYIIFCPYHNNNRTPAGEVAKLNPPQLLTINGSDHGYLEMQHYVVQMRHFLS